MLLCKIKERRYSIMSDAIIVLLAKNYKKLLPNSNVTDFSPCFDAVTYVACHISTKGLVPRTGYLN